MASLHELMAAAVHGARSLRVQGWMREECEGAALLGLALYEPVTTAEAFRRGRFDALDELRRLTAGRRVYPNRTAALDHDLATDGFADVHAREDREVQRDRILRWAAERSPRARCVVEAMLEGRTEAQAARLLAITESLVSQILHDSRRASSRT